MHERVLSIPLLYTVLTLAWVTIPGAYNAAAYGGSKLNSKIGLKAVSDAAAEGKVIGTYLYTYLHMLNKECCNHFFFQLVQVMYFELAKVQALLWLPETLGSS